MPISWKNQYYGNGYCDDYEGGEEMNGGDEMYGGAKSAWLGCMQKQYKKKVYANQYPKKWNQFLKANPAGCNLKGMVARKPRAKKAPAKKAPAKKAPKIKAPTNNDKVFNWTLSQLREVLKNEGGNVTYVRKDGVRRYYKKNELKEMLGFCN